MANTKTSALTSTTPDTTDILYVVDGGNSRQTTIANLISGSSIATATNTLTLTNKTLTSPTINTPALGAGSVDAITEIASALKSGSDVTLITGTKGTSGDLALWNADGDLVDGPTPPSGTIVGHTDTQTLSNKTYQNATLSGDANITSSTGNVTVEGVDPWRTVSIFGGLKPTTTAGCAAKATVEGATNDIDYDVLDFATGSDENAFVNFRMPTSWDGGVVQFQYVWTSAGGTPAQTVTFELSGRAYADSDAIDQASGTAVELADTLITTNDIHISDWSGNVTVAGTTPTGGQWVHFEIMRDVSEDNVGDDARLIDVNIRYKQGTFSD